MQLLLFAPLQLLIVDWDSGKQLVEVAFPTTATLPRVGEHLALDPELGEVCSYTVERVVHRWSQTPPGNSVTLLVRALARSTY